MRSDRLKYFILLLLAVYVGVLGWFNILYLLLTAHDVSNAAMCVKLISFLYLFPCFAVV
jgi:hypothetical protein